jgi:hypothetical protein
MDKSLKLKLFGPSPDLGPKVGYDVGASERKQCPNITDGGCMAASGDECSIVLQEQLLPSLLDLQGSID